MRPAMLFTVFLVTLASFLDAAVLECRRSNLGTAYRGVVNVTASGRFCQPWSSQTPHQHNYTDVRRFPDGSMEELGNYCRNPDQLVGGPWCYTTDRDAVWEHCDVPHCALYPECRTSQEGAEYRGHLAETAAGEKCVPREHNLCRARNGGPPGCYVDRGGEEVWEECYIPFCKPSAMCLTESAGSRTYVGTIAVTVNGYPCQRWDRQAPHTHGTQNADLPDGSLSNADNFCRDPDGKGAPWCYTLDRDVTWEFCTVPVCEDCLVSSTGEEYAGTVSVAASGAPCVSWTEAAPNLDLTSIPDSSLEIASNYCRSPVGTRSSPWCYTGDAGGHQAELCDIPKCEERLGTDPNHPRLDPHTLPRRVRHVVHIGIDGLHPCFVNASGGAPNIVGRVGVDGSWTLTMGRTALHSDSGPGWSNILSGMPMETTGVDWNSYRPPHLGYHQDITPAYGAHIPMPTGFTVLKGHDVNIRTASYYDWDWLSYLASFGGPGSVDYDYYCTDGYEICDDVIARNASDYISKVLESSRSSYTFVYLGLIDIVGHDYGWCGDEYMAAIDQLDDRVGLLLDGIEATGYDESLVVVSSDHGGHGTRHGDFMDSDLHVPVYFKGTGVKKNYNFIHEVRNQDVMPTITHLMGFPPSPWWKGNILREILEPYPMPPTGPPSAAGHHQGDGLSVLLTAVVAVSTTLWN